MKTKYLIISEEGLPYITDRITEGDIDMCLTGYIVIIRMIDGYYLSFVGADNTRVWNPLNKWEV